MKSLASYLITIFVIFFWIFRIVVAVTATLSIDIGIEPINLTHEIILLFVTLLAIILIVKRNIIGALIYFASYLLYFGSTVITQIIGATEGTLASNQYLNLFFSILGIFLAIVTLLDVLFNKNRTNTRTNKKTDWFYGNKEFDRKLDERADKNNYRTMWCQHKASS